MDSALLREIAVGMVLHLDPKTLLGKGGNPTGPAHTWVHDGHFFLCVEVSGKRTRWLPLFSTPGPHRIELSDAGRTGHAKWSENKSYFHPEQVWTASREAIVQAAAAGGDRTRPGSRKFLDPAHVPVI